MNSHDRVIGCVNAASFVRSVLCLSCALPVSCALAMLSVVLRLLADTVCEHTLLVAVVCVPDMQTKAPHVQGPTVVANQRS